MKDKSLESIFRKKLEDLRIEPSDQAKGLIRQRIKKRGRIVLYRRLSIAAGILLIVTIGLIYLLPQEKKNPVVNQLDLPGKQPGSASSEEAQFQHEMPKMVPSKTDTERGVSGSMEAEKRDPVKLTPEVNRGEDKIREEVPVPPTHLADRNAETASPVDSTQYASEDSPNYLGSPFPQELANLPVDGPARLMTEVHEASPGKEEPVKITIEYIASGSKTRKQGASKTQLGEIYTRMNKLVYPEEVLGDIRTLKDQLFALEFINRKSTHTQNNKEK